jgi:hypothetical protein
MERPFEDDSSVDDKYEGFRARSKYDTFKIRQDNSKINGKYDTFGTTKFDNNTNNNKFEKLNASNNNNNKTTSNITNKPTVRSAGAALEDIDTDAGKREIRPDDLNLSYDNKNENLKINTTEVGDFSRVSKYDNLNVRNKMQYDEQEESSDQYNNEEIIASILETFKFSRERFEELNEESTKFVKTYWTTMNAKVKAVYFHYRYLDPYLDSYLQFGADKCSVRDIFKFCNDLNIDYDDLLEEIEKFPMGMDTKFEDEHKVFRGYAIYSRDRKLGLRVSSKFSLGGYFHYFNAVGDRNAILNAFKVLTKQGKFSEICWGGPF